MKIRKFMTISLLCTLIAFGYVYQRVELVKTGYCLQKNRKQLSYLIDQNSKLVYNLSKLESPGYLLATLNCEEIEFAQERRALSNSYSLAKAEKYDEKVEEGLLGRFFDIFTVSAEAKPR